MPLFIPIVPPLYPVPKLGLKSITTSDALLLPSTSGADKVVEVVPVAIAEDPVSPSKIKPADL